MEMVDSNRAIDRVLATCTPPMQYMDERELNTVPNHSFSSTGNSIAAKNIAVFFYTIAIPPFTEGLKA